MGTHLGRGETVRFGVFRLDLTRRVLSRGPLQVKLGSRALDLLCALIDARGGVVEKDRLMAMVWPDVLVEENNLHVQVRALRRVLGVQVDGREWISTVAGRGYRFGGHIDLPANVSIFEDEAPAGQEIAFSRTDDGVTIASAAIGQGPLLVRTGHWMTHIRLDWRTAAWAPLLSRLSDKARLIRYDPRGTGLSDWSIPEYPRDFALLDLGAVMRAHGLGRVTLLGMSQGAAAAIAYAATHPDRVERLILHGSYGVGWRASGDAERIARGEMLLSLIRLGWGQDTPAFRQVFTSLATPDATREEMDAYNELQRQSASPENAARLASALGDIDVRELLPKIRCPTLVMHNEHDAWVPIEMGRAVAARIPNARFVALESPNHVPLPPEPAWRRFVEEIIGFLPEREQR